MAPNLIIDSFRLFRQLSEILIDICAHCNKIVRAISHGVLSDGTTYTSTDWMDEEESKFIGQQLDTSYFEVVHSKSSSAPENKPWWVKAKIDDNTFLVSKSSGFDVWNSIACLQKEHDPISRSQ